MKHATSEDTLVSRHASTTGFEHDPISAPHRIASTAQAARGASTIRRILARVGYSTAIVAGACFFHAPAYATLVSSASSSGGALTAGCNANDGGTGNITTSCSGGGFTSVSINAGGPPQLTPPDLSATTLTVAAGPLATTTTLTVDIDSSGWSFAGGPVEALFTVNNLIGAGTGPFTLSASNSNGDVLTHTFNGAGSATDGPTVLGAFISDAAHFSLTFNPSAIAQSIDATIEIEGVAAPEPASLALLGVGLLALGLVRQRRV